MSERFVLSRPDQLRWPIQPSARLQAIIVLLLILALGASVLNNFPTLLRIGLVLMVVVYGAVQLIRAARPRWKAMSIDGSELILLDRTDTSTTLTPGTRSFVSPLYIGVVGQAGKSGKRLSLGLFRDQLDSDAFRRLSVLLRRPSR
ncbi:MAG: protein YgfX [Wenzhouxiangella sp.]